MYVFDTSLEASTTLHRNAHLQRMVSRLPREVMRAAKRDRVRLLAASHASPNSNTPWSDEGLVTFCFRGENGSSSPVFSDRRDHPLNRGAVQRVRAGSRVRLSIRQVRRRHPRPGSRLQVLKVQVLDLGRDTHWRPSKPSQHPERDPSASPRPHAGRRTTGGSGGLVNTGLVTECDRVPGASQPSAAGTR